MSASRRLQHWILVKCERSRRLNARRHHACRSIHWRPMLATMTLDPWRQPHDQRLRVATMYVRCREHRTMFDCSTVITHDEERQIKNSEQLRSLVEERIRLARYTLMRALVPHRFRRQLGCL